MEKDKNLSLSMKEVQAKVAKFCAYQERCYQEVMEKLMAYGLTEDQASPIIEKLQEENFFNEERFARAFALDKFHQHKWGKNKIRHFLQQKNIPESIIRNGLDQIDPEEYRMTAKNLLQQKQASLKSQNPLKRKQKTTQYLLGKGYEWDLVEDLLEKD